MGTGCSKCAGDDRSQFRSQNSTGTNSALHLALEGVRSTAKRRDRPSTPSGNHRQYLTCRNRFQPTDHTARSADVDTLESVRTPATMPAKAQKKCVPIDVPSNDSSRTTRHEIFAISPLSLDRLEDWVDSDDLLEVAAGIQLGMPSAYPSTVRHA